MTFVNVASLEDRLARGICMEITVKPTQVIVHAPQILMSNALMVTHVIRLTMFVLVEIRLPALDNQVESIVMQLMKFANVQKTLQHVLIRKHVAIHMLETTKRNTFASVVLLNLVQKSQLEVTVTLLIIFVNVPRMLMLAREVKSATMEHVVSILVGMSLSAFGLLYLFPKLIIFLIIYISKAYPTNNTSPPSICEDSWTGDCEQYVWACTDSRYPWYKESCKKTCGHCGDFVGKI